MLVYVKTHMCTVDRLYVKGSKRQKRTISPIPIGAQPRLCSCLKCPALESGPDFSSHLGIQICYKKLNPNTLLGGGMPMKSCLGLLVPHLVDCLRDSNQIALVVSKME